MLAMLGYDEDTKEDKSGFKLVSSNFNAWYAPVRSCKGDVNRVKARNIKLEKVERRLAMPAWRNG